MEVYLIVIDNVIKLFEKGKQLVSDYTVYLLKRSAGVRDIRATQGSSQTKQWRNDY